MEKITLLVIATKHFDENKLKQKLEKLTVSYQAEILIVSFQNKSKISSFDYPFFSVEAHDDIHFTQLLESITTEQFLFFDADIDYPSDFFLRIANKEEETVREKGTVWQESVVALQQSHYGLCGQKSNKKKDFSFLNYSVLFSKKEVQTLNTDKLSVHPETAFELYRYAEKKKLNFIQYVPPKEKIKYLTHFRELMAVCQQKAQKEFKIFPAFFVLFFLIFGVGAAFNTLFLLLFLIGMSAYFMAITLEAFGIATIKKNGALLLVLLFLFPFVHLVYGLESVMARLKAKS